MRELSSYSIDELEALTGFDRRTVSYYSAEGLLPKVGRRGPKTRYSQEFVDRLNFIKRAKELQDAGKLPSVRLQDIARLINGLTAEQIVEGGRSNRRLMEIFAADVTEADAAWVADSGAEYSTPRPDALTEADLIFDEPPGSSDDSGMILSRMAEPLRSTGRVRSDVGSYTEAPTRSASLKDKLLAPLVGELQEQIDELRSATQAEAYERESTQQRIADISRQTEQELRQLENMFDGMRELRTQVERETRLLRDNLDELRELRETPLGPRRPGQSLNIRARKFAKRNGLDTNMLRVAPLRPDPDRTGRQVWTFSVDRKMLMMDDELTVLCQGRGPYREEGEFIALVIPKRDLADVTMPLFKAAGAARAQVQISAEDDEYLRSVNCRGLDLRPYRQMKMIG